jgi:hypothetical protein
VLAFAALAPVSLVALPLGALLVASGPGTRAEWLGAGLAGSAGAALVAVPPRGLLDAVSRVWIVLVTVAFVAGAKLRPGGFWRPALRACLYAAAGVTLLVAPAKAGAAVWTEIQWEATRDASRAVRYVIEVAPGLYPAFEPAVRLFAVWPLWLVLESLAGLGLAWRGHALIARTPLSAPSLNQ